MQHPLTAPHDMRAEKTPAPDEETQQIADWIQPTPHQRIGVAKRPPADQQTLRDATAAAQPASETASAQRPSAPAVSNPSTPNGIANVSPVPI